MSARGMILFDLVAMALAFWTARLVRRDRLYVGYGVIVIVLLAAGVLVVALPLGMWLRLVAWLTGAQSPAMAIAMGAALGAALLVIYTLSQLTILSNRLTAVVQELALDHADLARRPDAASQADSEP